MPKNTHTPTKSNDRGFGAIAVLLVLLVIGLTGFAGWHVWKEKHNSSRHLASADNSTSTTTAKKDAQKTITTTAPPTSQTNACGIVPTKAVEDWKTYSNDQYKFSISYPTEWSASPSGGTENNSSHTPILTELLFTPPHNQGPQYDISITNQTIEDAVADWKNSVSEAQSHSAGTTFTIVNEKNCTFNGYPAERIDTKQAYGTTTVYDGEFYVAANGNAYKFSTTYHSTENPFGDKDLLNVVGSLVIKE